MLSVGSSILISKRSDDSIDNECERWLIHQHFFETYQWPRNLENLFFCSWKEEQTLYFYHFTQVTSYLIEFSYIYLVQILINWNRVNHVNSLISFVYFLESEVQTRSSKLVKFYVHFTCSYSLSLSFIFP